MTVMNLVAFVILLSVLILVHEIGHFVAAKRSGVWVEEFGVGYPPRVFGVKIGETIYSLNWLPLGGFVKLYGEEGTEGSQKSKVKSQKLKAKGSGDKKEIKKGGVEERAFYVKPTLPKSIIVIAGVVMNLVLAVVAFSVAYSISGIPEQTNEVQVLEIVKGSPAEMAGMQIGDVISEVRFQNAEVKIQSLDDFSTLVKQHGGELMEVLVERDGKQLWLTMMPRRDYPENQGPTGVTITYRVKEVFYPWWQMPFRGVWAGLQEAAGLTVVIVSMLGQMIWKWISEGIAPTQVGGIVEVYYVTGQAVKLGWVPMLRLTGILSLNLAVINLFPFPALDGGRLAVILIEGVTKRKLKAEIEYWLNMIGFVMLILLVVVISFNDINRRYGDTWWVTRVRDLLPR